MTDAKLREKEALKLAIETKEIVMIRYHGGSQPGSFREIVPVSIKGDLLYAHCVQSDSFKSFKLEKLEIVEDATTATYTPGVVRKKPKAA